MAGAAVVGKILGVAGGLTSSVGSFRGELSGVTKLMFDAAQAANNAERARQDQIVVAERGAQERAALSKQEQQVKGDAAVGFAGGNVVVDTGTPLEYKVAQSRQFAAERATSTDEEAMKVHALETERQGLLAESRLLRKGAKRAKRSAKIGLVGGALKSFS